MSASPLRQLSLLLLLISCASGQVTQCAPDGSPQLRFVAQLSVGGCALFVHDTGASDGPHLAVEPLMCVTDALDKLLPRYDPITQQMYVSVPVIVRDDAMLTEAQHQLRHLSPKSVKFATVSDISVSTDSSSAVQALGFDWTPEHSRGILRLGCVSRTEFGYAAFREAIKCALLNISYIERNRSTPSQAVSRVTISAAVATNCSKSVLNYHPMMQNSSFIDPAFNSARYSPMPTCQQLRFIRSIRLINCTARVHQRLGMKGHFLIEPLLCHNITSMSSDSVMYDYVMATYFLKLDVVLQDDITVESVRTHLSDLAPLNVSFMRLWHAQGVVSSALSRRFAIGPLMVSADGRSAQVRLHCRSLGHCQDIRRWIQTEPFRLWRHEKWSLTSLADKCLVGPSAPRYVFEIPMRSTTDGVAVVRSGETVILVPCSSFPQSATSLSACQVSKLHDGRDFISVQQRISGRVSFQRNWTEYESGFGDESDFWIGLSTIHSLSINGATLRVEMKLWNGTQHHFEYAGFTVGDASTKYRMTFREMLEDRSSFSFDAMGGHDLRGMQFSTMDRDTRGCSNSKGGKDGWWHNNCAYFHPNGEYGHGASERFMVWYSGSAWQPLREVRLMLQI